jgi:dTDP-4-dehydrorhamnose reductase
MLTGANGQVGWELAQRTAKHEIFALDRAALDITQPAAVQQAVTDSAADLVINAAAYTGVDRAEQEPDLAFAANRDGPAHLATACAQLNIPLFHISTDYVFDGKQQAPYREDDPVAPLGIYGRSKWEGEEAVRHTLPAHIILRVSWVFGRHGHNFVKTMLRLAREREQLRVVADQHGCPTYAGSIADVLLTLADRFDADGSLPWGTYHYCDTPATTWHGFTEAIVAMASDCEPLCVREVLPITTREYPTPAARPANSVLNCSRIRDHLAIAPGLWQTGLSAIR